MLGARSGGNGGSVLVTAKGTWTRAELAQDPFGLVDLCRMQGFLELSNDEPEKVVSALLLEEGAISKIYLGGGLNLEGSEADSDPRTQWVFQTSGSTGRPKPVAQKIDAIVRKIESPASPGVAWGFLTEITRMAGIQVAIEAFSTGSNLVIPDSRLPLSKRIEFFFSNNVTHLSATPSQWRQVLAAPLGKRLTLKQATLGGEVADQKILTGIRVAYPSAKITHVYATTEVGPVFAVSDGIAGFSQMQLGRDSNRIHLGENGEIGVTQMGSGEVYWTGDLVERVGERYFFIGRLGDTINVGGAKVHPAMVEAVLLDHPNVLDCLVTGQPNSIVGELVVADVVLENARDGAVGELRGWCRDQLLKHAVPKIFRVVESIPATSAGKKVRR